MLTVTDIPVKPRILIADDSRIVRAALIKQIEGMFEFREALDGEQAWEALLLDQSIRVVITDLTMPRLDGYGLLERIRGSRISRIRDIPVVVVSGSDEQEERERARAAGASDLVTKGIGTAHLLSRLDVLAKLVSSESDLQRGLELLVSAGQPVADGTPVDGAAFRREAESLLQRARKTRRNFVLLHIGITARESGRAGSLPVSETVMEALGQLLQRTVRHSDKVARTGDGQFSLAVGGIGIEAARTFGQRLTQAISNARIDGNGALAFSACCGIASLDEIGEGSAGAGAVQAMQELAGERTRLGAGRGVAGVVGAAEEAALKDLRAQQGRA